ncbi:MAG: ABC transporter substrate-binding protein, partial [Cyclobacteriaceae bacterium]
MKFTTLIIILLMATSFSSRAIEVKSADKSMITAGGTITEIVHELGFGASIIATDITSTYPASMQELPSIGYRNQIKAEGILALGPDMVLIETGYLTADVVAQLKATGLEIHEFDKPKDVSGTYQLIGELAHFLEVPKKGEALSAKLRQDIKELENYTATITKKPKMAFVMARG